MNVQGLINKAAVKIAYTRYRTPCPYDVVEYSYTVDGKSYINDKIRLSFFSGPSIEHPAKNFKTGQSVTVYYNPKKPSQSVLELSKQQESFAPALLVIFAALLIGIFIVMKYAY